MFSRSEVTGAQERYISLILTGQRKDLNLSKTITLSCRKYYRLTRVASVNFTNDFYFPCTLIKSVRKADSAYRPMSLKWVSMCK